MLYYGILLTFILEYVRPVKFVPFLSILHLNSVIPVGVALLSIRNNKIISNMDFIKLSSTKNILILLGLIGIGILWVDVKHYVWWRFLSVLGWFFIYLAIVKNVDGKKGLAGILAILIICHLIILILTPELILAPEVRNVVAQETFLGDGNDFALSLNIVIPFCIYFFLNSKSKSRKLFFIGLTILLILGVVGTSSRGGSMALAVVLFYQWFKGSNKLAGLAGVAILIVIVLLFAPPIYFERLGTIKAYETEGSAQGRIMAWKSSLRMAADHPLTGVGAGHFSVKYGEEYRPPGIGRTEIPWSTAHSVYFLAIGELGIPGILVVLALILPNLVRNEKIIRFLARKKDSEVHLSDKRLFVCLNSSMIGFAVGGIFLSALYYPHLYVLAGLMEVGRYEYQRRQVIDDSVLLPATL